MDPNHWNTYNFQYGAAQSGLTPTHPSLGLSLSHGLQGAHSSIGGRSVSALPSVNYTGLSVPLLESMTSSIQPQQAHHKSMGIGETGQIVFDPQVRSSSEQLSPSSINRYEAGNKVLRTEGLSRNQLLEAARVWSGTNFPASSSLYNQYSILPDVASMAVSCSPSIPSSPGVGSFSSSKSNQLQQQQSILQEPPPAHSSSVPRITSCQRTQNVMGDLIYTRPLTESLNPSSISLSYSSGLGKDSLHGSSSNLHQQTTIHHRQTPIQTHQAFLSPHGRESESISSGTQHQLYGSYGSLSVADSDYAAQQQHLSGGDLSYEAVSPAAPPVQQQQQENTTPAHMENSSFSLAHFHEFANLAPEHAQAMVDKFQENDFRLKLDPMRGIVQQTNTTQDALSFHQGSSGHRQTHHAKTNKDTSANLIQSLQMNQQQQQSSSVAFSHIQPTANISHSSSPHHPHSSHSISAALTLSSMQQQQLQAQPTVQAPADSTTKPKRVRNRKKKDVPSPATSTATPTATNNAKKSVPHTSSGAGAVQRPQHHDLANLSHIPPSSQVSTLSLRHSPQMVHDNHHHQQQQIFTSNQYTSRDAHRSQTPSMPQNYSLNEPQGYSHSPSPKIQNSNLMSPEFNMSSRISNEKSSTTYSKQRQRKPKELSPVPNVNVNNASNNQNNQSLYMSNIPNSNDQITLQQQGYSTNAMMNISGHSDSPIRTHNNSSSSSNSTSNSGSGHHGSGNAHISRLANFPAMSGQHQAPTLDASSVSNMNPQQTTQDSKLHTSSHYLTDPSIINIQQQSIVSDGRQQQQHSNSSQSQSPSLNPQQQVVMSQTPTAGPGYDTNRGTTLIIDGNDPTNQFQVDFGGQPFLEQLVSAQNPSFGPTTNESGEEVILTTLVTPAEQQQEQTNDATAFRPTYHGAAVHEIHPVASFDDGMNVGEMSFDDGAGGGYNGMNPNQQTYSDYGHVEVEPMTLTFMPSVDEDDEFNHFSHVEPATTVKKELGIPSNQGAKKDNFQDSFLSYLQGNKQETLSSVSSAAITKKPQLPKYIPEPRRPRPPVTIIRKETPPPSTSLADDSDDIAFVSAQGKDFLSTLSDNENSSQNSDKEGYTVQRTSELAMKITLPKGKKKGKVSTLSESALLSHNKKQLKEEKIKVKKKRGKLVDSDGEEIILSGDDRTVAAKPATREATPPPVRTSIGRKAKDKGMEKSKKKRRYADSDSSSEDEIFVRKTGLDDKDYDSDKDPVWSPFDTDLKVGYDLVEKKKKPKRIKLRAPIRAPPPFIHKIPAQDSPSGIVQKTSSSVKNVGQMDSSPNTTSQSSTTTASVQNQDEGSYPLGQYLIEKKDLQNYENYPIWRLEPSNMIHKFELVIQDGIVRHKAVGTYSTWMKSMFSQFEPIKVNELVVKGKSDSVLVQVLDEYQPKVPTDGKLIQQYEDDPLVESFNIYLQVFISQALEPTFLKCILDMGESFYLDPLNNIDSLVDAKVKELAEIVKWKPKFQDVLHKCPLVKEIDRPNLKQACQACENSSPPTIKSVLLSGNAYDRKLLTDIQGSGTDVAQEFMIGKVAAHYVHPYHSLYHFKHWLRSRCEAKVKVMMESNKNLTGEKILDKCLENRTWVLQLFDNLKKLLAFEGEASR